LAELQKKDRYNEHIILNAIGGKLTSRDLLCRECAEELDDIDKVLTYSLNLIGLLLNIKRDRLENPSEKGTRTDTGEKIYIAAGGKPVPIQSKPVIEKFPNNNVRITGKDNKQLKDYLKSLKRKGFLTDSAIEDILKTAQHRQELITSPIDIKLIFGDDKCFRSVCKMAINYYIYNQGNPSFIKHLIPYIKDGECSDCVWYYYPENPVHNNQEFIHTLFIKGDPDEKILYAYIELFNTFNLIVMLSDFYDGTAIQKSYSFDVISRQVVELDLNIQLCRNDILNLVKCRPLQTKLESHIINAFNNLQKETELMALRKRFFEILKKHFTPISEGEVFTEDNLKQLSSELAEALTNVLYYHNPYYNLTDLDNNTSDSF